MKTLINWFARNTVAANLLMVFILVAGYTSIDRLVLEFFPDIRPNAVTVGVPYLGAAPEEVEEAVCRRIEEALQDLEGVKKLTSIAAEGFGTVVVELDNDTDARVALDQVKARVDAIATFPAETEKPLVQEITVSWQVLTVAVYGDVDEHTLRRVSEEVRDDLTELPDVTQVKLGAIRPYEISIEVSENDLRRFGLTFDEVVQAVRAGSLDLPGGSVRTVDGEVLLRTTGQAYLDRDFERLPVRTRPDGTRLLVGDVATVKDGFADSDLFSRFNGKPTTLITVQRVGKQNALEIADQVKAYINERAPSLPEGITVTTWQDETLLLRDRLRLLIDNGWLGLVLVFVVLATFVRLRLACWVSVGIAVSFMGALALLPAFDVSINMISLFAFVMVLGIVVDDAIVVGENIYRHHEMGKEGLDAAIGGAQEVAIPVTFSILTTIAAFLPLLMVDASIGQVMRVVPLVAISCLLFSLVESMFILPSHLSHLKHRTSEASSNRLIGGWRRFQDGVSARLRRFVERVYQPVLVRCLEWRYLTLAAAFSLLIMTFAAVGSGWVSFTFFPPLEADNAVVQLAMPQGTPASQTSVVIERLERAARQLELELEDEGHEGVFQHLLATVGEQPFSERQSRSAGGDANLSGATRAHVGEINIELMPSENRTIRAGEIVNRWRQIVGPIPDASELVFQSELISFGDPINVQLQSRDLDQLEAASSRVRELLEDYPGVFDIRDSLQSGKQEIKLQMDERGEALGLDLATLGRQVRNAFYGAEAQRIQRGRDEVRVMVRYPEAERRSLESLEQMRIRTPRGAEVPFATAAKAEMGQGYDTIERVDRQRTATVTADLDSTAAGATATQIAADLNNVLPEVLAAYPRVSFSLEGEQNEQREALGGLAQGFLLSVILIYALLAIPFRSYLQPAIVMSAIPFGMIGAIWGHAALGMDLTVMSGFGVVALTGVVVNDSLVMVDFINRRVRSGLPVEQALADAGAARFRPILMTSLTTFAGLTPLLLEKSIQAQFLVPMAVSLAFGVLFATAITLILVPVLFRSLEDLRSAAKNWSNPQEGSDEESVNIPAWDVS